jgi:hypothetical protein
VFFVLIVRRIVAAQLARETIMIVLVANNSAEMSNVYRRSGCRQIFRADFTLFLSLCKYLKGNGTQEEKMSMRLTLPGTIRIKQSTLLLVFTLQFIPAIVGEVALESHQNQGGTGM